MIDGCRGVGYKRPAGACTAVSAGLHCCRVDLPQGPAPEVGQHTELTLLDLGYTWEEITALKAQGAII